MHFEKWRFNLGFILSYIASNCTFHQNVICISGRNNGCRLPGWKVRKRKFPDGTNTYSVGPLDPPLWSYHFARSDQSSLENTRGILSMCSYNLPVVIHCDKSDLFVYIYHWTDPVWVDLVYDAPFAASLFLAPAHDGRSSFSNCTVFHESIRYPTKRKYRYHICSFGSPASQTTIYWAKSKTTDRIYEFFSLESHRT